MIEMSLKVEGTNPRGKKSAQPDPGKNVKKMEFKTYLEIMLMNVYLNAALTH